LLLLVAGRQTRQELCRVVIDKFSNLALQIVINADDVFVA
jgi:hypothetical protein